MLSKKARGINFKLTTAEPTGYGRLLQIITATFLVQIPGEFHKGQKNIVTAPAGGDGRLDDLPDGRQQLALAFGRQVAVPHRRPLEVESRHSALPPPPIKVLYR